MSRQDLDLAKEAYRLVTDVAGDDEYRTRMRSLPSMLRTMGLAATLAFLRAKSESASKPELRKAYRDTSAALEDRVREVLQQPADADMLHYLCSRTATVDRYRLAFHEVEALSLWLKRITEAAGARKKP